MSEREWQPGASDTGEARGEESRERSDVDATGTGKEDAQNVEGVQGAQGGREERDEVPRERPTP